MYQLTPVFGKDGELLDLIARKGQREIPMLGSAGMERELYHVRSFLEKGNVLPVFLGSGLGFGLKLALEAYPGPVAIVDKEQPIRNIINIPDSLGPEEKKRITLISPPDPIQALQAVRAWQLENGNLPLYPVPFSFYQRIDPAWYGKLRTALTAHVSEVGTSPNRKFPIRPKVLLLSHKYFLMGEIKGACEKLGLEHKLIMIREKETDSDQFIQEFLSCVNEFRPDVCITLNHMGVDMEGVLMHLLERLELPLASWFVDNPHLIIHLYNKTISPWVTIFTWDEDNIPSLKSAGYEHVYYLPLGTDPERFRPNAGKPVPAWRAPVSFVGNSMVYKVAARLKAGHFPAALLKHFHKIAKDFAESEVRSVADFMAQYFSAAYQAFLELPSRDAQLAWETAVTWKATQIYRNERVAELLPFEPLIVGDEGWKIIFRYVHPKPRWLAPINYYDQLPIFYGESEINFNATSRQMKGAVNQRVFDAPAAGGFVLTDWRPQMGALFDPDQRACYHHKDEIPELVRFYLSHPDERQKITKRARTRVLSCHTWADRLKTLLATMREIYHSS